MSGTEVLGCLLMLLGVELLGVDLALDLVGQIDVGQLAEPVGVGRVLDRRLPNLADVR